VTTTGPAHTFEALLAPYTDPDPTQAARRVDVPPPVAARALELLPTDLAGARLNLVQPPMTWFVQLAEQLGGRLVGSLTPGRGPVVFDGLQVDAPAASGPAPRGPSGQLETTVVRREPGRSVADGTLRHCRRISRPMSAGSLIVRTVAVRAPCNPAGADVFDGRAIRAGDATATGRRRFS
jgi:hypothetical protein